MSAPPPYLVTHRHSPDPERKGVPFWVFFLPAGFLAGSFLLIAAFFILMGW